MPPVEWYYAKDKKQSGPVSAAELKQLATSGQISPEDLVWRDGLDDWMPARKVKGLFERGYPGPPAPPMPSTPATPPISTLGEVGDAGEMGKQGNALPVIKHSRQHPLDLVLDFARKQFPPAVVEVTSSLFNTAGHYCLYAAMVVVLIAGVIRGFQDFDQGISVSLGRILSSLIVVVVLLVLQYTARRFSGALERLNRSTEGRMNSTVFSDCFALISMVTGLSALLGLSILALQTEVYLLILPAVGIFIAMQYVAIVAVNLDTLNIHVDPEAGAGEEAIGILSFFAKIGLRVTPVAFGVGVVLGTLSMMIACGTLFFSSDDVASKGQFEVGNWDPFEQSFEMNRFQRGSVNRDPVSIASKILILFGSLPVVVFIMFLVYHLFIDLASAVLSLDDKSKRTDGNRDNGLA